VQKEIKYFKSNILDMDDPTSRIGRVHVVEMAILLRVICRSSAIPIKIPMPLFREIEKSILKHKMPQITKAILSKKEQCWRYHNPRLQTLLQTHSNKNSVVLAPKRHEDQWIRRPRNKPTQPQSLFFDNRAKNLYWRNVRLFDKQCWEKQSPRVKDGS
jgi:hypothetical protein